MQRIWEVDFIRGIAIVLMIVFHIFFDLDYFTRFDFSAWSMELFWLARATVAIFVFLVGVSLTLSYAKTNGNIVGTRLAWKYIKRGLRIFSMGLIITAFTLIFFPQGLIFFGIIHFIGAAIIISYPLLSRPKLALPFGLVAFVVGLLINGIALDTMLFTWLGFSVSAAYSPGFYTFDLVPLFPWLGIVFLGIFAGSKLYPNGQRAKEAPETKSRVLKLFSWMGRKSLIIYFLHQPAIITLLWLAGVIQPAFL
ncbi:MAG: hypothetical protein CL943_02400 [Candidatus Diapherotrites archaeon]|uniref:Heparan-alpha-glucosaminide N-acetyltransferase catalytic domain-containing protein n=1 Tax=Candidatus Iainarchaeum sp. TaxID=3101447 RepID=A0A2D6M136_9ARCH|nr:hypothetical protein [Candidatus Diapherotrites archaeon]|tara:strand:- start:4385 stop:5140 length:756 start_codon:yes stop_codon:yes gene_type:complete